VPIPNDINIWCLNIEKNCYVPDDLKTVRIVSSEISRTEVWYPTTICFFHRARELFKRFDAANLLSYSICIGALVVSS